MARHDKNTYIACRPGLQSTLAATFGPSMHIEVDNSITSSTGYEFRSKDLESEGLLVDIEEEVRKETLQSADPKNAYTVVVPLHIDNMIEASEMWDIPYVAVRFQNKDSRSAARAAIAKAKIVLDEYDEVDEALSLGAIVDALHDADINVLSASIAEGLAPLNT